ncbi:MAG: flagellar basal body rod C-terminal domain-containing protein, partial [Alphaproteobacteria bacterium]
LQFTYDGSPAAVSTDPGTEVIRKLNSQIVALTDAFTNVTAGTPTRFALAYNSATTGSGELASSFFSVTTNSGIPDPNTFVVNANLLNGTSTIKQAAGATVVASLSAARSFTADGLSIPSGTYTDLSTGILAHFQQAANTISGQSETAQQQQTYYQQSLSNATGVNVDNELVNLTTLQNSYAASARVIGVINQMMEELTSLVG